MPDTGGISISTNATLLLKKLDPDKLIEPSKVNLLRSAAQQGADHLRPIVPRLTGASAGKVDYRVSAQTAKITAPSFPLIFLEGGSQYHEGEGKRAHTKKTKAQFRAGRFRIKPRRFLSKTRTWVRQQLANVLIPAEQRRIESEWSK